MPSVGSPNRAFRLDDLDLWTRFGAAAAEAGSDRSAVLREFIRWYVRDLGARMPQRPGAPDRERPPGTP